MRLPTLSNSLDVEFTRTMLGIVAGVFAILMVACGEESLRRTPPVFVTMTPTPIVQPTPTAVIVITPQPTPPLGRFITQQSPDFTFTEAIGVSPADKPTTGEQVLLDVNGTVTAYYQTGSEVSVPTEFIPPHLRPAKWDPDSRTLSFDVDPKVQAVILELDGRWYAVIAYEQMSKETLIQRAETMIRDNRFLFRPY